MKKLMTIVLTIILCFVGNFIYGQGIPFNYIAPIPGSEYINPEQSIILKTGIPFDLESINDCSIKITGSLSGHHTTTWKVSEDSSTIVIIPDDDYLYSETVTVNVSAGLKTNDGLDIFGTSFYFKIKTQDNLSLLRDYYIREYDNEYSYKDNLPSKRANRIQKQNDNIPANYPGPEIVHYGETNDNYLFLNLRPRGSSQDYENYLSINDKYGIPLFFRKTQRNSLNFHKLPDGRLAYARNDYGNPVNEKYFFMDSSYVVVDSVKTGNGYNMDGHDILLLENGNYLLMSYDPQPVDMSLIIIGGNPNATVIGLVIQEVDLNQTVYFQWRSWDHFNILDATSDINLLANEIDYVHGNAFEFDVDGNLLISSRHMDEITKINFETGDIMYRFGLLSKNNQFTINNDPIGFSHQHDVRLMPNGNITLYDNGNLHANPTSRAIEYSIDETTMTATRVWEYQHDPTVYGPATGCYRRTSGGSHLVGWGATGPLAASEINTTNSPTFDVFLPDGVISYRILKYAWSTNLFTTPALIEFGNYSGYTEPKTMIIPIHNNSDNLIRINSTSNHSDLFEVVNELPLTILAGETIELTVSFQPTMDGTFDDRLTLNYDNFTLETSERIARQLNLHGIWDNSIPIVTFLPKYGTNDVDPETNITILFSEPIRKIFGEQITNNDIPDLFLIKVSNQWGDDITFSGVISEDRKQITLFPDESLDEMQQYFVQLFSMAVEDDNGNIIDCAETTLFTTGLNVDVETDSELLDLSLYPSPFNERLIISSNNQLIGSICIYNISGVEIFNSYCNKIRFEIDTRCFSKGVYFIKVINDSGKVTTFKVMKVR